MIKEWLARTIIYDILGKRSFAQAGEDMILRDLVKDKKNGYFVDIGAYHPKQFSNTYYFYRRGWRGINVEPNGEMIKLLDECRPGDLNLRLAVGGKKGWKEYFYRTEAVRNSLNGGGKIEKKEKVSVVTMKWLLDQYLPVRQKIDVLSVDTEGDDMEILRSNDWKKYQPEIIVVETVERRYMKKLGYKLVGMTGYSEIWIKR